jgi:inner membrane protein
MNSRMNSHGRTIRSLLGGPVILKMIAIGVLTLVLLVPATMIQSLIRERENRQKEVIHEISSKWGHEQTIIGPVISIPYQRWNEGLCYLHFLPDTLHVSGTINPEKRHRGTFDAVMYNAQLVLTGNFSYPDLPKLDIPDKDIEWSGATLSLGISDIRGLRELITVHVNDVTLDVNPGLPTKDLMSSGVSAPIALNRETKKYTFRIEVNLNGSEGIDFVPTGKTTTVSLSSGWPNPSFRGAYLPAEREMTDNGFTANWTILDLNREYPQQWKQTEYTRQAKKSAFGVGLFTPVDFYQKSMRTTKYAILFVVLTFLAFLVSEMVAKVRLHPMQYLLIGLAIITFYTLLLSLSEHIGFTTAYAVSSVAVIILVAAYAKSILKRSKLAITMGAVLAAVYGYSYWLLQMVDYALVAGSVGLFIVLSIIMFFTRDVDWYSIKVGPESGEHPTEINETKAEGFSEIPSEG